MAGSVTTNLSNSWLAEVLSAGHCFLPPQSGVAVTANTTTAVTLGSATPGIAVGMAVTGTNVPANCVVSNISAATATSLTISQATTGACSSMTFTGDVFKIALISSTLAGNVAYGAGGVGSLTTNYGSGSGTPTQANLGTDEQSGTGTYSTGGLALVPAAIAQTNPINSAAVGYSTTIQWTGATINTAGAMIYNTTTRLTAAAAPQNNRVAGVFAFSGSVVSGTLTLTQPTQDGHTGLMRLSPN